MITIDGSEGEGGGQVLRTAIALALVTGQAFKIDNIRAKRPKPGLMRQHVTAVEAACAIGGASCDGLAVGAGEIVFRPGRVAPGDYHFAVGTAGSTALVLQTILVPLMTAGGPSRLVIEGGTHNTHAPPFDFLERTFLPLLARMGPQVSARLIRHGFYPAGGGRIQVDIVPAPLGPVELIERGERLGVRGAAVLALLDDEIGAREIAAARAVLDWPEEAWSLVRLATSPGPGNVLLLEASFERVTEIVTGFGQLGVSAQSIGNQTASRMLGYLKSGAFAGPYLADQLLLPMVVAGKGCFTTVKPSQHTVSAAGVIGRFLGPCIEFGRQASGSHLIGIERR